MEQAKLTPRQQEVLQFIVDYHADKGYSPTYAEIAENFGLSSKHGPFRHVKCLVKKGYLKRAKGIARSIVPIKHVH